MILQVRMKYLHILLLNNENPSLRITMICFSFIKIHFGYLEDSEELAPTWENNKFQVTQLLFFFFFLKASGKIWTYMVLELLSGAFFL